MVIAHEGGLVYSTVAPISWLIRRDVEKDALITGLAAPLGSTKAGQEGGREKRDAEGK